MDPASSSTPDATRSPPISFSVTSFNGKSDLRDCLKSVYAQEGVTIDEVIVVDNASTDGTAELVRGEFPDARLIVRERNDGPCPARNEGLAAARNRLLVQLDQDVVLRPDTVARLLPEILGDDDVAVVSPRSLDAAHPDVVHYDGGSFHYAGVMSLRNFYRPAAECSNETEDVDAFISLAVLLDRDKVLEVGGYDDVFFILFEDHDISYRLRLRGYRIRSVPHALVDHRAGTEGISYRGGLRYPARRLFLHSRNRWVVVLKCYHWRTFLVTVPGVLLLGVAYVIFAWRQGALGDYVRAKASLIRNLSHIRRTRREIASWRRVPDRELLKSPDLTFSPRIERGRGGAFMERALSSILRAYWFIARHLVA